MPVLAAFAAVAITLLVGIHLRGSLSGAWQMLHIPALSPSFADTRTITHSIDCLLKGQDPYTVRSFDPWHRLYNYPPVWLDLRYLGVTSRTTNLLGIALAIMTGSALLLLFRARTWMGALVVFFATTSAAVLFAVERGNNDQVIFFLLVVGLFLIDQTKINLRPALKSALIVILTILKIFPVVAAAVLVRNRKGTLVALLTAALSIVALVITCGRRIPQVLGNTPQDVFVSFGALPFFVGIFTHTSHPLLEMVLHHPRAISLGALILAVLSSLRGRRWLSLHRRLSLAGNVPIRQSATVPSPSTRALDSPLAEGSLQSLRRRTPALACILARKPGIAWGHSFSLSQIGRLVGPEGFEPPTKGL